MKSILVLLDGQLFMTGTKTVVPGGILGRLLALHNQGWMIYFFTKYEPGADGGRGYKKELKILGFVKPQVLFYNETTWVGVNPDFTAVTSHAANTPWSADQLDQIGAPASE